MNCGVSYNPLQDLVPLWRGQGEDMQNNNIYCPVKKNFVFKNVFALIHFVLPLPPPKGDNHCAKMCKIR